MSDWQTIIVRHIVMPSKTAFALREDNGEGVFIPPAVSKTLDLSLSDIVQARLVPNAGRDDTDVPWFCAIATRDMEGIVSVDEVVERLKEYDYPVEASEAEVSSASLQMAYQEGRIVKIVVMPGPKKEKVIMWAADMERV